MCSNVRLGDACLAPDRTVQWTTTSEWRMAVPTVVVVVERLRNIREEFHVRRAHEFRPLPLDVIVRIENPVAVVRRRDEEPARLQDPLELLQPLSVDVFSEM